jgi:hypothetical protein
MLMPRRRCAAGADTAGARDADAAFSDARIACHVAMRATYAGKPMPAAALSRWRWLRDICDARNQKPIVRAAAAAQQQPNAALPRVRFHYHFRF